MKSQVVLTSSRETRPDGLLGAVLNVITHPALAGYTPAGPGSLATGQAGVPGRCQHAGTPAHSHFQQACDCFA